MKVGQSDGQSDYKKYPIAYTTNALTAEITYNSLVGGDYGFIPWVKLKDKTQCLVGNGNDYTAGSGSSEIFNLIIIGF